MTPEPIWKPSSKDISESNLYQFMQFSQCATVHEFHQWTVMHYDKFWGQITKQLDIKFAHPPSNVCDLSNGIESPCWFPGATLNIADSCFNAPPGMTAIKYLDHANTIREITYDELNQLSNQVANSLVKAGYQQGDAIGIAMPMNHYAVAIYLGIIKMGGVVVSIADSFAPAEIQTRIEIARASTIFTQDYTHWNGKQHPLYEKIAATKVEKIIVLVTDDQHKLTARKGTMEWKTFLTDNTKFTSVKLEPMAPCQILFSSGTTSAPKAIVWNHTTPIKCASDAYFHQNIKSGDVLCWPSNLGWMMGAWLIFAGLINKATIALYTDIPKDKHFGEFVQNAKVTMLGVVPTLVAYWHQTKCMESLDWHTIKLFTSTGECSNPTDMRYLSSLAKSKPIIEYCGGTEIGGGYLTSTVLQDNYASLFTTPAMGMQIQIMDEQGNPAPHGEVTIIPPSIGLSTKLLNGDHHKVYYADMPICMNGGLLRRHGDEIIRLENGLYSILGRTDDTMNLGGIKIGSAEIERVLSQHPDIIESAAVAINPSNHGPAHLVIFAVSANKKKEIKPELQALINKELNPLFKIHDLVFLDELPKTASNKIMRRVLRSDFMQHI